MKESQSAFPIPENPMSDGMSLRDYFAAKALQGFCANPSEECTSAQASKMASWCYMWADAMLVERNKTPNP